MPVILVALALLLQAAADSKSPPSEAGQLMNVSLWQGTSNILSGVPSYPVEAVPSRTEGVVEFELVVSTTGRVLHRRLSHSAGDLLDRHTAATISRWRFTPFKNSAGQAIPVLLTAHVEYRLGNMWPFVTARLSGVSDTPPSLVGDGVAGDPLSSGTVMPTAPTPVRVIKATYSEQGMRAKVTGDVQLEVVILPDGTVGRSKVVKSLEPSLDHQARIAAGYWLFNPALLDGKPVAVRANVLISFSLR